MILRQAQGIRRRHARRDYVAASRAAAVVPPGANRMWILLAVVVGALIVLTVVVGIVRVGPLLRQTSTSGATPALPATTPTPTVVTVVPETATPVPGSTVAPAILADWNEHLAQQWRDAIEVGWQVMERELGFCHDDIHKGIAKTQKDDWQAFLDSIERRKRERG